MDENGLPCGWGETTYFGIKFSGTWLDGQRHGYCRLFKLVVC